VRMTPTPKAGVHDMFQQLGVNRRIGPGRGAAAKFGRAWRRCYGASFTRTGSSGVDCG
jgi:hypothetical protein